MRRMMMIATMLSLGLSEPLLANDLDGAPTEAVLQQLQCCIDQLSQRLQALQLNQLTTSEEPVALVPEIVADGAAAPASESPVLSVTEQPITLGDLTLVFEEVPVADVGAVADPAAAELERLREEARAVARMRLEMREKAKEALRAQASNITE